MYYKNIHKQKLFFKAINLISATKLRWLQTPKSYCFTK